MKTKEWIIVNTCDDKWGIPMKIVIKKKNPIVSNKCGVWEQKATIIVAKF